AWITHRSGVTAAVTGARTSEQMAQNMGAWGFELPAEALDVLEATSAVPLGYPYEDMMMIEAAAMRPPRADAPAWPAAWRSAPVKPHWQPSAPKAEAAGPDVPLSH